MNAPSVSGTRNRRARSGPQLVLWAAVAAVTAASLAGLSTAEALRLLGLSDPGPVTVYGLPAVTAFGEVAAVLMVGSLLLATVLVPAQPSGLLDVDGYLALRTAGAAAATWACCAILLVALTLSDTSGRPLSAMIADPGPFLRAVGAIDITRAWVWTAVFAGVVALGCRVALRHRWTPVLLVLAVLALMPRAVSGHSASGGSHDIATNSLVLHLVAAALWAGGLAALVLHVRRGGSHLAVAVRRFSRIATVSFVVMAFSGIVNALVRVPMSALVTSTYGALLLAKSAAFVVVGMLGLRQRRVAMTALGADPDDRRAFTRLATAETIVLVVTVGLAVALGRTPPPPSDRGEPSPLEETLGYDLDGPPSWAALTLDWRFDLLYGCAALLSAAWYLRNVKRVVASGGTWSRARTAGWLGGCALVLVATSAGVGRYAPAVFSVHAGTTAVLMILAPLCLAAGAPLELYRATGTAASPTAVPGVRDWIRALRRGPVVRALTRPAVVWVLFVGGFPLFYFGGIHASAAGSHVAHVLATGWFLGIGYLLFWVGLGIDPTGHPRMPRRHGTVFVLSALAAYLAAAATLRIVDSVIAAEYYVFLHRGWRPDLAADQRVGANVAVVVGWIAVLTVVTIHARGPRAERD
ncbi:cytochrome c oxidase assembly protein [Nocardia takedensis]